MAQQAFVSGTKGYVQIGTLTTNLFAFKAWSLAMNCPAVKMNNFLAAGYQRVVAGVISGKVSVDGPYDPSNMPFSIGSFVSFVLGVSNTISLTLTALIVDINLKNDEDDAPRVTIAAESDASFTASIV